MTLVKDDGGAFIFTLPWFHLSGLIRRVWLVNFFHGFLSIWAELVNDLLVWA